MTDDETTPTSVAPSDPTVVRDPAGREIGVVVAVHPTHVEIEQRTGLLGLGRRTYVVTRDRVERIGDGWLLAVGEEELEALRETVRATEVGANVTPGPPTAAR